jgi:hypothetical protein
MKQSPQLRIKSGGRNPTIKALFKYMRNEMAKHCDPSREEYLLIYDLFNDDSSNSDKGRMALNDSTISE